MLLKYNENNDVNLVEMMIDVQKKMSSLDTNMSTYNKNLEKNTKKIEDINNKAIRALNISEENAKELNQQKDSGKQSKDHKMQYIVAIIGSFVGPTLVSIAMKML